jgi:outer membrane lipoprotein carrier protein
VTARIRRAFGGKRGSLPLIIVGIFTISFLFGAGPSRAQEQPPEGLIDRVQSRYEQTRELEATFTQQATLKTLNETQASSGKVYIKKPGKMRWDYLEPEHQVILLKDDFLRVYTPEFNQLVEQPITNLYKAKTPIAFLAGQAKLKELFKFKIEALNGNKKDALWRIILRPKEDNPQLKELHLEVDPSTYDINRSVIIDHFGNKTDIRYINIRVNHGLDEGIFVLKLPPNVERVRPPSVPFE